MPQKRGWGQASPSSGRECGGWTNGSVACRSWEGEGVAARDAPWEQTICPQPRRERFHQLSLATFYITQLSDA
ncbi:hypothetical protein TNCV_5014931 [Trichonephila clavipes]|nr:hypothetical protein TNCV_5014931 [Trichonephila clavipes]